LYERKRGAKQLHLLTYPLPLTLPFLKQHKTLSKVGNNGRQRLPRVVLLWESGGSHRVPTPTWGAIPGLPSTSQLDPTHPFATPPSLLFRGMKFSGVPVFCAPMAPKIKYDWDAIHQDFIRSNISLRDLAKKHGMKYRYLTKISSEQKWFEQRDTYQGEAREAVAVELTKQVEAQNGKLGEISVKTASQQMKRSMQTGDRLYTLFQSAVTAMQQGDLRTMRQAIDAWVTLDSHMRKVHNIDDHEAKPVVNIAVLSAMPDMPKPEPETAVEI